MPRPHQLVWVDRTGKLLGTIGEPGSDSLEVPAISPDGSRVAAGIGAAIGIVVWDIERGIETRLIAESEGAFAGGWLAGSREFAYSPTGAEEVIRVLRADGSGKPRILLDRRAFGIAASRDGAYIVFYTVEAATGRDLWALPLKDLQKKDDPFMLLGTSANEAMPQISPDGRWLVYQSDASNQWEVYVQPFPQGEGRLQISNGGGQHPIWNPRGGVMELSRSLPIVAEGTKAWQ